MMASLPPELKAAASMLLTRGSALIEESGWLQHKYGDAEGRVSAAGAVARAAVLWYNENYYPGKGLMIPPAPIPGEYMHDYRFGFVLCLARLRGEGAAGFYRRDAAVLGEWPSDGDGWCGAVWAAMNRLEGWLTVNRRLLGCPADGGWKPPVVPLHQRGGHRSMADVPTWPRVDWWNDRPERTAGEVERALREAAQPLGAPQAGF